MKSSISRQLSFALSGVVVFGLLFTLALLAMYETRASKARLSSDLDASAAAFAKLVEPVLWNVDLDGVQEVVTSFSRDPRIARITVREETTDSVRYVENLATADTAMRTLEVRRGTQRLGTFSLSLDRQYYRDQLVRQATGALIAILITLAATLLTVRLFFRRLLRRPLDDLSRIVSGYATGAHDASARSIRYEEFVQLSEVLDSMSNQIQRQLGELGTTNRELAALNRFLVNISADLEPPLLLAEAQRELQELFGASGASTTLVGIDGSSASMPEVPSTHAPSTDVAAIASLVHEVVPIIVNGDRVGALTIRRPSARPFMPAEVALANTFARQVAAALTRYRAHESEHLLRAAIEQMPDSVILADAAGVVVYVNQAFTTISGYAATDVLGKRSSYLDRYRSGDGRDDFGRTAVAAGESWIGRLNSKRQGGEEYVEDVVISPVRDALARVSHYVIVGRDISEELQREAQLRHAQRMEGVGQLAGGVAHDFNNMLGAILMQIELIELDEQLSPALRQETAEIRSAIERAANLTRQLLMFSRRQAMRVLPYDLSAIVADILRLLQRVIGEEIDVRFDRPVEAIMLEGDESMIQQVILNLCLNARDAMPTGGRLTIATRHLMRPPGQDREGTWAMLEVSDTGTGMSQETMSRIFEPFFTTKEVGKGTGLGLATTQGIVEQHGGWIDVESDVGVGTTFRIHFPALAPDAIATPPRAMQAVRRGNATILVVEDEAAVRQMVGRVLRHLGYRVLEASSGPDALRLFETELESIDLVLTDVVMPGGVDGVQLVQELRRQAPDLRAIVMSGYSAQLAATSIPSDVSYLAKPFSMAALSQAVEDVLRGE